MFNNPQTHHVAKKTQTESIKETEFFLNQYKQMLNTAAPSQVGWLNTQIEKLSAQLSQQKEKEKKELMRQYLLNPSRNPMPPAWS